MNDYVHVTRVATVRRAYDRLLTIQIQFEIYLAVIQLNMEQNYQQNWPLAGNVFITLVTISQNLNITRKSSSVIVAWNYWLFWCKRPLSIYGSARS